MPSEGPCEKSWVRKWAMKKKKLVICWKHRGFYYLAQLCKDYIRITYKPSFQDLYQLTRIGSHGIFSWQKKRFLHFNLHPDCESTSGIYRIYTLNNNFVLGGGFKDFLFFTPKLGEMIQFDEHIFQRGWFNHQLDQLDNFVKMVCFNYGWL